MDSVFIKEEICDFDEFEPNSLCKEQDPLSETLIETKPALKGNESKLYQCKICGKGYSHRASFRNHSYTHSAVKHKCEHCGREFVTAQYLKSHQHYMHSDPETWPHQCELCPKKFPLKSKLDAHLLQHTNTKAFSCEECAKKFYTKNALMLHRLKHSDLRAFSCNICSKSFKSGQAMRHHIARFHVKHSEFYCAKCKLEFDSAAELEEHIKNDRKDNVCPICSREFKFKGSLTSHMEMHKNEKSYKCNQCFRSFNTGDYLFSHKRNKHDLTSWKYFCGVCNKRFPVAHNLNRHQKFYKPYVCQICKVKFEHDCNIDSHYATHGSRAEYHCSECDTKCKTRRGLHRHLKASHSNKVKEESVSNVNDFKDPLSSSCI